MGTCTERLNQRPGFRVTCGEVLDDAGRRGVEDDVGTLVQVMQVIATVKSSVAEHVVESQLLHAHPEMKAALRGTARTAGTAKPLMGLQARETANRTLNTFCFWSH